MRKFYVFTRDGEYILPIDLVISNTKPNKQEIGDGNYIGVIEAKSYGDAIKQITTRLRMGLRDA